MKSPSLQRWKVGGLQQATVTTIPGFGADSQGKFLHISAIHMCYTVTTASCLDINLLQCHNTMHSLYYLVVQKSIEDGSNPKTLKRDLGGDASICLVAPLSLLSYMRTNKTDTVPGTGGLSHLKNTSTLT